MCDRTGLKIANATPHDAGTPGEADRPSRSRSRDDTLSDFYLGVTRLRIGETDQSGAANSNAWQQFGFDLDGLCTSARG